MRRFSYSLCVAALALVLATACSPGYACSSGDPSGAPAASTPNAEFIDNRDGSVTHLRTALVWKRCLAGQSWVGGAQCGGDAAAVDWDAALRLALIANHSEGLEWRLPTRKELESIVEYCAHDPALNQDQFPPAPLTATWSSTSSHETPEQAWYVDFSDGYSGYFRKDRPRAVVRLVRDAAAGSLLTTQNIIFGPAPSVPVGGSGVLSAISSAALPVVLGTLTPEICTVSASTVSGLAEGICIITADQGGSPTVYPAARATLSFAIGRQPQTITFSAQGGIAVGTSTTLSARASSGLPVVLSTTTPAVCSLNGSQVRGLTDGNCTVIGHQGGNSTFSPASPASIIIAVGTASGSGADNPNPGTSYEMNLLAGWHLLGNGTGGTIDVAARFGDPLKVESVWKWLPDRRAWAFFTPALAPAQLQGYLSARALQPLTEIGIGEAYWVKLKMPHDFGREQGAPYVLTASALRRGWNLVTVGEATTPGQLNLALATDPPVAGVLPQSFISLWAWDATRRRWFFYSPELDAQGGGRLKAYAEQHGYLDFASEQKQIGRGVGFWIKQ